jgi:sterol desaturase/sphingolipid hydroxylase (fatty acid hydroxylase superfamily)
MLLVVGPLLRWRNSAAADPDTIPGFMGCWQSFLVFFLMNENMFYWGHRALHSKLLYKSIHKQHHKWVVNLHWAPRSTRFSATLRM